MRKICRTELNGWGGVTKVDFAYLKLEEQCKKHHFGLHSGKWSDA